MPWRDSPRAVGYESNKRWSSLRKFESCLVRPTTVVTITTFSLRMARFRCPVAYPFASLAHAAGEGWAVTLCT